MPARQFAPRVDAMDALAGCCADRFITIIARTHIRLPRVQEDVTAGAYYSHGRAAGQSANML